MGFWDCDAEVLASAEGVLENDFGTGASTIVRRSAFAEMVAFAIALTAYERAGLSIVKPGGAFIGREEIDKLAARPDYPGARQQ